MNALSWWRSWHGAPLDHKWSVIAARAKSRAGVVSAIAWALLDYASQQQERGLVAGFDVEEYSVFSGFPEDEINAVLTAMTAKGFIVDGRLAKWNERQPGREDDSAERVRKHRELKRNVTQCNAEKRDVTPQSRVDTELDTESDTYADKELERDTEESVTSPDRFEVFQRVVERKGIFLTGPKDIQALTEIINAGASQEDLEAGIQWRVSNNNGQPVRYVSQLVGPTKTAMAKRLQQGDRQDVWLKPDGDGRVTL